MKDFPDNGFAQDELNSSFCKLLNQLNCIEQSVLISPDMKNGLWTNIYKKIANYDFEEIFMLTEITYDFNPEKVDFKIEKPYLLNACVYDFKVHQGDIYCAVYFALNTKIGQICMDNGFRYSLKKNIWVKKISLNGVANCDSFSIFHKEIEAFLNDVLGFCHVLINKETMKKYFNFSFVGGSNV